MDEKSEIANPSDCDCNTWVYIWKTTAKTVGHVGIKIGGCEADDAKGHYASLHPTLPAFGPTIVYPLPAALNKSLEDDKQNEGEALQRARQAQEGAFMTQAELEKSYIKSPDYVFFLKDLNTQNMRTRLEQKQEKIDTHELKYQLFPQVRFWEFFNHTARDVSYNPIDTQTSPIEPTPKFEKHNCATFVADVLKAGGKELQPSKTPWGLSPSTVAQQLAHDEKIILKI